MSLKLIPASSPFSYSVVETPIKVSQPPQGRQPFSLEPAPSPFSLPPIRAGGLSVIPAPPLPAEPSVKHSPTSLPLSLGSAAASHASAPPPQAEGGGGGAVGYRPAPSPAPASAARALSGGALLLPPLERASPPPPPPPPLPSHSPPPPPQLLPRARSPARCLALPSLLLSAARALARSAASPRHRATGKVGTPPRSAGGGEREPAGRHPRPGGRGRSGAPSSPRSWGGGRPARRGRPGRVFGFGAAAGARRGRPLGEGRRGGWRIPGGRAAEPSAAAPLAPARAAGAGPPPALRRPRGPPAPPPGRPGEGREARGLRGAEVPLRRERARVSAARGPPPPPGALPAGAVGARGWPLSGPFPPRRVPASGAGWSSRCGGAAPRRPGEPPGWLASHGEVGGGRWAVSCAFEARAAGRLRTRYSSCLLSLTCAAIHLFCGKSL